MNIALRIDELALHGFAAADRQAIGAALQRELTRLISDQGVPAALTEGSSVDRLDAGVFNVAPGMSAEAIGAQVAQAVYGGLSR